jgi:hypothetical protein
LLFTAERAEFAAPQEFLCALSDLSGEGLLDE